MRAHAPTTSARSVDDLLGILATGHPQSDHLPGGDLLPVTEVVVGPLSAAGVTEPIGGLESPAAGLYHARARGRHIVIDADEMHALRDAGAGYDDGQID
jgi:hypothetical protein